MDILNGVNEIEELNCKKCIICDFIIRPTKDSTYPEKIDPEQRKYMDFVSDPSKGPGYVTDLSYCTTCHEIFKIVSE